MPRLEDAIALTRHLDEAFCWNLELKTRDSFAVVSEIVPNLQPNTTIAFTSFWHDGIAEMIGVYPDLFRYALLWASHPFGFDTEQWFESYPQITALVFYQERLSAELVEQCHQKGVEIWTYGDRTSVDREKT